LVCHTPDNQIPMSKNISRFSSKLLLSFLLVGFFSLNLLAGDGDKANGKKVFKANCATCHKFDAVVTGPALSGVYSRVPAPAKEWLHSWIKNNNKVIASGDAHAKQLVANNGGADGMGEFEWMSDKEIDDVVAYLEDGKDESTTTTTTTTGDTTGITQTETGGGNTIYYVLGSIVLLMIFINVFRQIRISLQNEVNRKKGKPVLEEKTFMQEAKTWTLTNRRFLGVCGVVLLLVGSKSCWDGLWDIGVYAESKTGGSYDLAIPGEGRTYKPSQPIKFNHKLHAGDNEIACQYCHSTVEKSRHAGIPTVNTCMNCHKGISKGPTTGETEIAKIYAASGFNPKTMKYENPQNPIKWIKVHNLPDHVYFSHQHHVVIGKQDCANCHGDVKKMTVAEQVSPLTMGWCIDCHRKTEVPGMVADKEGKTANPYYQKLHDNLAAKFKGQKEKITVAKMGGIECAKCHY
jgi:cytochrome c2